jgi:hypothetical protein
MALGSASVPRSFYVVHHHGCGLIWLAPIARLSEGPLRLHVVHMRDGGTLRVPVVAHAEKIRQCANSWGRALILMPLCCWCNQRFKCSLDAISHAGIQIQAFRQSWHKSWHF